MATRITDRLVEQVKPGTVRREIGDALVPSLYLVVQPSGARSFAVRYRHGGKTVKHTIGPYPRLGLAEARDLARAALRSVAEGRDPAALRRETRRKAEAGISDRDLFERAYGEYLDRHVRPHLRPRSAREIEGLFRREILPQWHDRRLGEIGRADVRDLVDGVVDRGVSVTANKTFAQLKTFFNWCVSRDLIPASPCAGIGKPAEEKSRDRKLSDDELRWLWRACDEIGFPFGPIVKLLLITGTRREEVRAMTERELDVAGRLWTIPAARTKNGLEHQVALAEAAAAILDSTPRVRNKAGYVFSVTGETPPSGFSRAKRNLDKFMLAYAREAAKRPGEDPEKAFLEPWTLHDLRRTMASGMARLGVALPVTEKCLNHISGSFSGIVGVYQQHEFVVEKRAAFDLWSRHVAAIVIGEPANVISIEGWETKVTSNNARLFR